MACVYEVDACKLTIILWGHNIEKVKRGEVFPSAGVKVKVFTHIRFKTHESINLPKAKRWKW